MKNPDSHCAMVGVEGCFSKLYNSRIKSPTEPMLSTFPSIRVSSIESVHHIKWPKDWSFIFSISPSNEYSGLISFRIGWFDLLAVQGLGLGL